MYYFKKQADGQSWKVFTCQSDRESIGLVRIYPNQPQKPNVEMQTDDIKVRQAILKSFDRILRRYLKEHLRIKIVCEGQTEVVYIKEILTLLMVNKHFDVVLSKQTNPLHALEEHVKELLWARECRAEKYSEVWFVFDRDGHYGFEDSIQCADQFPKIQFFWTNPCIEYWFLLHFEKFIDDLPLDNQVVVDQYQEMKRLSQSQVQKSVISLVDLVTSPKSCLTKLKTYCPLYEKNAQSYLKLFPKGLRMAYERCKSGTQLKNSHMSKMPDLIDLLIEKSSLTREEFFELMDPSQTDSIEGDQTQAAEFQRTLIYVKSILDTLINNPKIKVSATTKTRILDSLGIVQTNIEQHF